MTNIQVRNQQAHSGGNHSAIIHDDKMPLGKAVYDLARGQFAFVADNPDLVLSAADQPSIVAVLNFLSR